MDFRDRISPGNVNQPNKPFNSQVTFWTEYFITATEKKRHSPTNLNLFYIRFNVCHMATTFNKSQT